MGERRSLGTTPARLQCAFGDGEKVALNDALLDTFDEKDRLEAELRDVKGTYKTKIEAVEGRQDEIRKKLRAGYVYRDVPVETVFVGRDTPDGHPMVELIRLDTGEVIKRRPATERELQMELDLKAAEQGRPSEAPPSPPPAGLLEADVIDAEFIDDPKQSGMDAYRRWIIGNAPAGSSRDTLCPYMKGSDEARLFVEGWDEAEAGHDYALGHKQGSAGQPPGDGMSAAYMSGYEAGRRGDPAPDDAPGRVADDDGDAPAAASGRQAPPDDTSAPMEERVAAQLRGMDPTARADYLRDLPIDEVRAIYRVVIGKVAKSGTRQTTMVSAILDALLRADTN